MKAEISIRPGTRADHHFVRDSFWRTYIASPYAAGASPALLDGLITPFLESWTLTVACAKHAPDEILGFVLLSHPRAVAWVHTKRGFRRRGVAKALLAHVGCVPGPISCPFLVTQIMEPDKTEMADFLKLANAHGYKLRFRPYLGLAMNVERKAA